MRVPYDKPALAAFASLLIVAVVSSACTWVVISGKPKPKQAGFILLSSEKIVLHNLPGVQLVCDWEFSSGILHEGTVSFYPGTNGFFILRKER